jgi:hypothetical protein
VNTYALFAELFLELIHAGGRAGVIVPTGIIFDKTNKSYFQHLMKSRRLLSVVSFYEVRQWFPATDDRKPFCLFTLGDCQTDPVFIFDVKELSEIDVEQRRFPLTSAQIALTNPNTLTSPVFISRADAELTTRIYTSVPVFALNTTVSPGWSAKYMAMLHMSGASGMFLTATQVDSHDPQRREYAPLVEAKMAHIYDHRWNTFVGEKTRRLTQDEQSSWTFETTPRYWVPKIEVEAKLNAEGWTRGWVLGWRETVGSEGRTLIPSIVPRVGVNNKLLLILAKQSVQLISALYGCLASLTCDYVAKQKVGGSSLNNFVMDQIAVLPPSAYTLADLDFINSRVLELTYTSYSMTPFARDLGYEGDPFSWDEDRRALLRAELDAWYARAYGLTRDELRYILDPADVMGTAYPSETFRVLKNNEIKKYGYYRTQRLVIDAWDRMERGELPCPQPYVAPPQTAAQSMTIVQRNLPDQNSLFGAGPLFEGIESTPVEHPRFVDPSTLPNGAWAMPSYNSISVQLQFAAILKQLSRPTSAARVRLAALYALNPQLLVSRLSGIDLKTWQRLIGNSARTSGAANVIQFIPRGNIEWRDAYTQLRGMHALLEDATNDTWAPGSVVQDFLTEGWADGRAGFVMKAMEGMEIEISIAKLPVDLQAWVKAHAA